MRAIVVRWALAGLVLAVVTLLIVSSSTAGRTRSPRLPAPAPVPASAPAPAPEGTSSTPAALTLPQTGTLRFRCNGAFAVQPVFDTRWSPTEEMVTMRAGRLLRRNYTVHVVGHSHGRPLTEIRGAPVGSSLALPFGDYRTVVVTAHEGTEARAIDVRLTVTFVDGAVHRAGVPRPGHACYATRWKVDMGVRPY